MNIVIMIFFVDAGNNNDIVLFLAKNGFLRERSYDSYGSVNKRIQGVDAVYKKKDVHVQVVQDAKKKSIIQEILKPYYTKFISRYTKEDMKTMWNLFFELYDAKILTKE